MSAPDLRSVAVDATAVATAVERDLSERIDRALLKWDELESEGEPIDSRSIACASDFRDLLVQVLEYLDYG